MHMRGARLGQHFLKDAWAARALAHAAHARPREPILEIGPGKGILTRELLLLGSPVVAVEKDEALVALLHEKFSTEILSHSLTIIPGDIRAFDPGEAGLAAGAYAVAANIPYYITGEIIRQFLSCAVQPHTMALLIQKEVAERIVSHTESILSLSVKAYGTPRMVHKVPRRHFSPPPSVDSAIIAIEHISKDFFRDISEDAFFALVRTGFAAKRKMLINNLSAIAPKEVLIQVFAECDIDLTARPENVSIELWKQLALRLTGLSPSS
jgi:16S rRNA (adenine1518-N6/adenine1519-N6)-dimethyltransferase